VPDEESAAIAGQMERVVLLHGFAGTSRGWDGVLAHLPAERYRPHALDLSGHGSHGAGSHDDGSHDDGSHDDGSHGDGSHDDGSHDDGSHDDGSHDDGSHGDGSHGDGSPGDGSRDDAAAAIDFGGCVASVLARSPESFVLCGYSLGGRLALHVALAAPERVSRLVLVASDPGIEDATERAQRRAADRALAEEIEVGSIERFVERWCSQPMFASDPEPVVALARTDYLRNRPRDLAAVLRGLGTGEMDSLWPRLCELLMPVTVIAGDRDAKFQEIAWRMVELLPHARLKIAQGGHRLPLESPRVVAAAIGRDR
jgi:2-succinyl-6-hydroxy-2,4-cyclohexadiene-1-carboxylate synthase